jgi:hypothetical protein
MEKVVCYICKIETLEWAYGGGKKICMNRECFNKARDNYIDTGTPSWCKGGK